MSNVVRIAAQAWAELDEAFGWLHERSPSAAARWYERLMEAVQSLETNPERCGVAPEEEWYQGGLRQLLYGKRRGVYRILFEIRGRTVYVLRVRHSAQALLEPGEL
jgi:plasmid stabilization system protein ParE